VGGGQPVRRRDGGADDDVELVRLRDRFGTALTRTDQAPRATVG
jgi:hypothetical protein